jgi:protein-tyrosine phosphatase
MRRRATIVIDRNRPKKLDDPSSPDRRKFVKDALGCLLLPVLSSPWLVGCGGQSSNPVVAPTPRLASVDNFRDVAGTDDQNAYRTAGGQKLRRGVVYRSNVLVPSASDLAILNTLGIVTDYDLRTPTEIAQKPDILPTGTKYVNINIAGTANLPTPIVNSAAETVTAMESNYRTFVTDSGIRDRFAQVFRALATTNGAQLYHCSAGKDRTGWTTAVLLSLVGVPQDVITQDYMLTNTYSAASIQATYQALITAYGQTFADTYLPSQVVQESYLDAAFDQAVADYGSMMNYITAGLGLDVPTKMQLLGKLLT